MTDFFDGLLAGIADTSFIEWLAVLTGITYVILAAKKMRACWPMAFISSSLYFYLCYHADLFIESYLQIFYVAMAVVGWIFWTGAKKEDVFIKKWKLKFHLINIFLSLVVAFLIAYIFDNYTEQANPYTDAFTTVFSLVATFLVVKKILSNWIYWIVIDLVSIYLYASRDFHLSAVLYFIFTILAVFGYLSWRKMYKLQAT